MDLQDTLSGASWTRGLSARNLELVNATVREQCVAKGDVLALAGSPAIHWYGVIDGLLTHSIGTECGKVAVLASVAAGAWFGECGLVSQQGWKYDVVALRPSRLATIPLDVFDELRQSSVAFNKYVQGLMAARLELYMGLLLSDRTRAAKVRMARSLAGMFQPEIYPNRNPFLKMRQAELALIAGLSRQRANLALRGLQSEGLVVLKRDGVIVPDVARLARFTDSSASGDRKVDFSTTPESGQPRQATCAA